LQIDMGPELAAMADKQSRRVWELPAARGSIIDAQGTPLVESLGTWTVTCDPRYMDDRLGATVRLSEVLGLPRDHFREQFEHGRNGRLLAKGLDDATADKVRALKLAGVYVRRAFTRTYHHDRLAAHVLGFVQADGNGGGGLEQQFNGILRGEPGRETLKVDALGHAVLTGLDCKEAKAGSHIQLAIDLAVQRSLQVHLMAAVEKHAPLSACGLVVRPTTGEIVALASWPDFMPQTREGLEGAALRNNPLTYVYEPGSTIKPLIAGAAVAERLARFEERINCEQGAWTYREGRGVRTIHEKSGGNGVLTVNMGIAKSDNIMMAKLGIRLGPERLKAWVSNLRFGSRTGICLPGEEVGIVPRGNWSNINEGMSVPMGHNLSVTPIQLALAHAAVANGGEWLPPRLVKRIWGRDATGREVELALPPLDPPRRMYEPADAAAIQAAMTYTMTEGTGKRVALEGYISAGKTGTAEKIVNGRYSNDHNVGSFVCWAPAGPGQRPELLALVIIDDPSRNGRFGSETAAPVVQKVLQEALAHLRVPPTEPLDEPKPAVAENTPAPGKKKARH
jgi:cell division protein FtsI (penicillin-binding protein 3)